MYCWRCNKSNQIKNNLNYHKKMKAIHKEKSKQKTKMAKAKNKSKKNQLKYIYYGKLNQNEDNCFILYPHKRHALDKKKASIAKIIELKKKFNSMASFSQITKSHVIFKILEGKIPIPLLQEA